MSRNRPPQDRSAFLRERIAQYCDGVLSAEDTAELEQRLREDPRAMEFFLLYMELHSQIAWNARAHAEKDSGFGVQGSGASAFDGAAVELPHQLDAPSPETPVPSAEPLIPPIIIDSSAAGSYPPSAGLFAVGSPLFSYTAAAAIMGVAVLVLWAWKVSLRYEVVESPRPATPPPAARDVGPVGRITGLADCRWSDPQSIPVGRDIALGQAYALSSGLMEITYSTGTKVILEGPCTYEVESAAGGFLSLGKLTARVEQGSGFRVQGSDSSNPKSQIPNPKFVVRTPTAVVTDLGTEFGVEVDKSGATKSHVFRGKIELRVAGNGGERPEEVIPLGESESARVERGKDRALSVVKLSRGQSRPDAFARHMPRRVPIKLFNTGVELREGDEDPHWQFVARSDDPKFKSRPALVTWVRPEFLPNFPRRSQWISAVADMSDLPNGVTYTFRTTFELAAGALPDTAGLRGQSIADNRISAIRLNGRAVPPPECPDVHFLDRYTVFWIRGCFVEGANVLEFDVYNGSPNDPPENKYAGPMAFLVELEGSVLSCGRPDDPGQPAGKEGTPMN